MSARARRPVGERTRALSATHAYARARESDSNTRNLREQPNKQTREAQMIDQRPLLSAARARSQIQCARVSGVRLNSLALHSQCPSADLRARANANLINTHTHTQLGRKYRTRVSVYFAARYVNMRQ